MRLVAWVLLDLEIDGPGWELVRVWYPLVSAGAEEVVPEYNFSSSTWFPAERRGPWLTGDDRSGLLICTGLLGAWVLQPACQNVTFLSPTHPVGQASCGGTAPNWPGAAQLEAGGSCPVRRDGLSHRRK